MPTYKDSKTGKWYCQFYYTDWQGKKKHKMKRGFERRKDAEAYEHNFNEGQYNHTVKMSTLIDGYLEHLETQLQLGNIKPTTLSTKRKYVNLYIREHFSELVASEIKPKDIDAWLGKISKVKQKELSPTNRYYADRGLDIKKDRKTRLSTNTLNAAKTALNQIFKFGIKNYGLKENPTTGAEILKPHSNDRRAKLWTLEQYYAFYNSLENETYRMFYNLLYWSGLRIGEALALTPSDITPFKIRIDKNYVVYDGEEDILTPKTPSSTRFVEIPKQLYFQLTDYISRMYDLKPTDRIFYLNEQTVREHLDLKTRLLNLPKISPHILRHSYASLLYNKTRDITVVSTQIGHKNAEITYKFYAHMLPGENRTGVDKLEEYDVSRRNETLIISNNTDDN